MAAGNSSSKEINTIIPATNAKDAPITAGDRNGKSIMAAIKAPAGSARPESKPSLNACHLSPVAETMGMLIESPSGMLCNPTAIARTIPNSTDCRVLVSVTSPSGKLCTAIPNADNSPILQQKNPIPVQEAE